MNRKMLFAALLVLYPLTYCAIAVAEVDYPLSQYETGDRDFEKTEIGDLIVYWHQRTIDGAIVEKDQIVYQFDRETKELKKKIVQWRDDLPEHISINIDKQTAESLAEGEPILSTLCIISPESDVFLLDDTPKNPCWSVRTMKDNQMYVSVIDAVTGEFLGYGAPPPYTAFSFSGPQYDYPCDGIWTSWYQNAAYWFDMMGHYTEAEVWPSRSLIEDHISNNTTGMFYELAHGSYDYFASGCPNGNAYEWTYAGDVEAWIADYPEMRFTFIGSCGGMCSTGNNTFSYEFRKGLNENTATVGYCNMAEYFCEVCWWYSVEWQDEMFSNMYMGYTVKEAFDMAQAAYPVCAGNNNCMRFAGDENFAGPYNRVWGPQCAEVGMIPDDDPVIVPPGGSFGLTGTIHNPTADPIVTDVWGGVNYHGDFYQQFAYSDISLNSGQFLTAHLNQHIPGFAPQGTYIYIAYCGNYPDDPCDSASFGFTVSGGRVDNGSSEWLLEGGFSASAGQPADVLVGAYPNPFNAAVTINYTLPVESNVNLEIYNLLGRKVETLVNNVLPAGSYSSQWDASGYASGIYYYKLAAGDEVFAKRMTLLK